MGRKALIQAIGDPVTEIIGPNGWSHWEALRHQLLGAPSKVSVQ